MFDQFIVSSSGGCSFCTYLDNQTDWFQSRQFSFLCLYFPFFQFKTTHISILASILFNFTSYSVFIGRISLLSIGQLLTQMVYTILNLSILMKILSQLILSNVGK